MCNPFSDFIARLLPLAIQLDEPISDAVFDDLARQSFKLQFDLVIPYQRLCLARQIDPERVREWRQVPAIPTTAFKHDCWTCLPPAERTQVFHSSGTTSHQPSRHFHSPQSLAIYELSLRLWFERHVLPTSLPDPFILALTPSPRVAPHSSLVHMFDAIRRVRGDANFEFAGQLDGADAWIMDLDALTMRLEEVAGAARPVALLGTAFALVNLLDHLVARQIILPLPPDSRVMETGGFKGRSRSIPKTALYELLEQRLGIPPSHIVSEYGMAELSSQAYDHITGQPDNRPGRVFQWPPWARSTCVSPESGREVDDGQTGLIRVVDLANVGSITAIQTEDLGVRRDRQFELIGRAPLSEPRGCSLLIR
jgi:hypothetical protein